MLSLQQYLNTIENNNGHCFIHVENYFLLFPFYRTRVRVYMGSDPRVLMSVCVCQGDHVETLLMWKYQLITILMMPIGKVQAIWQCAVFFSNKCPLSVLFPQPYYTLPLRYLIDQFLIDALICNTSGSVVPLEIIMKSYFFPHFSQWFYWENIFTRVSKLN